MASPKTAALAAAILFAAVAPAAQATCEPGVWRGDGVSVMVSQPAGDAPLRYSLLDGRRGNVSATSDVRCVNDAIVLAQPGVAERTLSLLEIRKTPVHFTSHGSQLSGVLYEPADSGPQPPLVVLVHGSERYSPTRTVYPLMFSAQGFAVFLYDKRGTGDSEGFYTQSFELLADDAAAAIDEARRVAAGRFSRIGFFGGSQGGWVAPLAATKTKADFVAVGFGLVISPLEEDQQQVFDDLREKHYGPDALDKARLASDATGALVASHFTSGWEQLAKVKQRYKDQPWFADIRGEFSGDILKSDEATLRRIGPALYDGLGIDWRYDAAGALRKVSVPQLWVLAGEDREAPGELTQQRLAKLRKEGRPIDLWVFPHTDHGINEFTEDANGVRTNTRVADGYFRLLADWIHGNLSTAYGNAQHVEPPR